jgi:hypothetical protein
MKNPEIAKNLLQNGSQNYGKFTIKNIAVRAC